jgi:hypothetical protein
MMKLRSQEVSQINLERIKKLINKHCDNSFKKHLSKVSQQCINSISTIKQTLFSDILTVLFSFLWLLQLYNDSEIADVSNLITLLSSVTQSFISVTVIFYLSLWH